MRTLALCCALAAACRKSDDGPEPPPATTPTGDTATPPGSTAETGGTGSTGDTAAPVPVVLVEGAIEVHLMQMADLDAGLEVGIVPEGDLLWQRTGPDARQLTPYNAATFAVMGLDPVDHDICAAAKTSADPVDASGPEGGALPVGTWLCGVTTEGLTTAVQVTAIEPAKDHVMTLAFTTWVLQ